MTHLFSRLQLRTLIGVHIRYKHHKNHWSVVRKRKCVTDKALQYFDDFYSTVYEAQWPSIREALLQEQHKYIAIVNNYSDIDRVVSSLELCGAMNLKSIYDSCKENMIDYPKRVKTKKEISNHKSKDSSANADKVEDTGSHTSIAELKSIDRDLTKFELDENRIVYPSIDTYALHEYVPATELKGKEDWVLTSDYYGHYNKGNELSVHIEEEVTLSFPEHLKIYTFEEESTATFPNPKTGSTGVLDYYLFDAGSILPVLALDLQPGDAVLDMCAAPGGKTLAIIQTLLPQFVVANDIVQSRVTRIHNVVEQFLGDISMLNRVKLIVTKEDARKIQDSNIYNKILVDVPCTTDRHTLHSVENNIFKPTRIKERLQIPQVQTEILTNALKLAPVGGTVVYSTCSLSPIENEGVVKASIKQAFEDTGSMMIVKDMTTALRPLEYLYKFHTSGMTYGHVVVPTLGNNCGPMYFCKIVKEQPEEIKVVPVTYSILHTTCTYASKSEIVLHTYTVKAVEILS